MAKFNISVDIDYIDENGCLDETLSEEIVSRIVSSVSDRVIDNIQEKATTSFESQLENLENSMSVYLNNMMDEFLSIPRDITDQWGDVKRKGVTPKQLLKEACDNFIEQSVDEHGKPVNKGSYNAKYNTRIDYIVAKSIDHNMEYAIKRAVEDVTNNLKKKISNEIKSQMGEKLAGIVGVDDILSGNKSGNKHMF